MVFKPGLNKVNIERVCILGHPPEHPLAGRQSGELRGWGLHVVQLAMSCGEQKLQSTRREALSTLPPTHLNNGEGELYVCKALAY